VVYHVRNNTQQYFTVSLPQGGKMLSDITVAGRAQQPQRRADREALLIRLPAAREEREEFAVRFVYESPAAVKTGGPMDPAAFLGSTKVEVPVLEDAAILESQLRLYLPSGLVWLDFNSSMRRDPQARGWSKYGRAFGWLIPTLGPQLKEEDAGTWEAPPVLTEAKRGPFEFQIPRDGQFFALHSLSAPGPVHVSYRSRTAEHSLEALGVLLGFGIGFLIRKKSSGFKMGYALFAGLGALVLEGAMGMAAFAFLHYFAVGVLLAVGFWVLRRVVKTVQSGASKTRTQPLPPSTPVERLPVRKPAETGEAGAAPESETQPEAGKADAEAPASEADKPQTPPQP
jgi:hypothetical protein